MASPVNRKEPRRWGRGSTWSAGELKLLADNPDMDDRALAEKLGRTYNAVKEQRRRVRGLYSKRCEDTSRISVAIVGRYLLEDEGAMRHWMHYFGYSRYEEVFTDELGWVTVKCYREEPDGLG